MKSLKYITLAVVAATGILSSQIAIAADPVPAAASIPAPAVGVVDVQKILADLPITKDIQKQLEAMRAAFATEVSGYETELRKAEKGLVDAQKKLAEGEFSKKREAFEKRIGEVQTIVEKRKGQLDKAFADAMEKVNSKVMDAISQVAKSKNLNLVLFPMSVAYSAETLDISKEVSEIVKKTLTNIKIEAPK